jgi:hypothetical protein
MTVEQVETIFRHAMNAHLEDRRLHPRKYNNYYKPLKANKIKQILKLYEN